MRIHYFQRYHSKENVDTANTMLMLSRLYKYDSNKFYTLLNELIIGDDKTPEIAFLLQVPHKGSVADATISQTSLKIVIETKLRNGFKEDQLIRHLQHFSKERIKVLLTIDPIPMLQEQRDEFEEYLNNYNKEKETELETNIKHVNITFEQLISALESVVDEHDVEIIDVINDYKDYCFEQKLIPDDKNWMKAVAVGDTFNDNMQYGYYFDTATRGYSKHGYIGLYREKSVRAIGKIKKVLLADMKDGKLNIAIENGKPLTEEEQSAIEYAINHSEEYGYNLKTVTHRYFLVDKFYSTDFKKASKNPIQKSKLFRLTDILGSEKLPETELIAKILQGKTWEEYNATK